MYIIYHLKLQYGESVFSLYSDEIPRQAMSSPISQTMQSTKPELKLRCSNCKYNNLPTQTIQLSDPCSSQMSLILTFSLITKFMRVKKYNFSYIADCLY